jgi:Putative bacterial sensory transduction regulator
LNKTFMLCQRLVMVLSIGLVPALGHAAPVKETNVQNTQADATAKVERFLQQSGFTHRKTGDRTWVVERQGKTMGKLTILVATGSGFMVAGIILAAKDSMNTSPEMMFKLLKFNHSLDYVKVGFDDDDDLFVRMEVKTRLLDQQQFNEVFDLVVNNAETVNTAMKPYIRR